MLSKGLPLGQGQGQLTFGIIKYVTLTFNDPLIFWGHNLDQTDHKGHRQFWGHKVGHDDP